MERFQEAYRGLNEGQKKAVDSIDGPVMVVAGPGTGKTQVLALRIANILQRTDVGADSILCLTFTRSGALAMRERLERYIGSDARKVYIETFHAFAYDLVERYYEILDFEIQPKLLDESEAVLVVDELLEGGSWKYIRPRANPAQYFSDLRQLISLMKRERMTPELFLQELEHDIDALKRDPESVSSRGPSKGQIKKEIEKKIESLERTKEVVQFYEAYEMVKRARALMDYDDVLEYAVALVETVEDVRADLRETYQYVLVDEHQDSSGVQNAFLRAVWQETEKPNIFVVGDDRQLIYGFSGASISYFEDFKHLFGPAELITLTDNYRSTTQILTLADTLLGSNLSKDPLVSNLGNGEPVNLLRYAYERDELLAVAKSFKDSIARGARPEECALLVPKNRHVRTAVGVLRSLGLPVSAVGGGSLFAQEQTGAFRAVLKIMVDPYDSLALSQVLLDPVFGIPPLEAHAFLHAQKGKAFTLDTLLAWSTNEGLFAENSRIQKVGQLLKELIDTCTGVRITEVIARVGTRVLIERDQSHEHLMRSVEVVRSFLHTALLWEGGHSIGGLSAFLQYIDRLEEYQHDIPLATFEALGGIQVMTLHKSKGLEFDHVWIAHANEETLMAQKKSAFTLPQALAERLDARDREVVTRELYVALTRAKKTCTFSYAQSGYDGRVLTLSEILADISDVHFIKKDVATTEEELLAQGPAHYIAPVEMNIQSATIAEVQAFVRERYTDTKVSVTLLNNFFECPWKWYFRNFLKLPEIKSVSLALGSAVHTTIEYILKSAAVPTSDALTAKIQNELANEGIFETCELTRLTRDALSAVEHWVSVYYPQLAKDRMSERSLSGKDDAFPHLQMYGKVDLTERFPDGDIVVTDFKTGSVKTVAAIEKETDDGRLSDYMRQLAMYSYLVRLAEKKDVARSRLLFVEADAKEKNAFYETHITDEQIDLLIRDIREYDEALKSGEWVRRECHHKGYGTNKDCEYCALAKVFQK